MRRSAYRFLIFGALVATPAAAQEHSHAATPVLGSVNFRNSGNQAAQEPFQRGVAWLHNFKYAEADKAFREAQRADASLAMAYWLDAMTFSHVVWSTEDLPAARAALVRLGPTPQARLAKAKTQRERAFGAAVEAFFADGPLFQRAQAYTNSLRVLAATDTTDLEAAAFASHGMMMVWFSATPAERPTDGVATARTLALRVFNANPNHPGATHYLTHVADMDPRASADLLTFARAYDKIAPDADHALHMPSHVYLPLGLWRDVSNANERAWAASRAEVKRDNAPAGTLSWHSLEWLQAAYLQEGRWRAARALIDTPRVTVGGAKIIDANADARFATNVLAFTYGMETGDWSVWPSANTTGAALFAYPMPTLRAWQMTMVNAYQTAVAGLNKTGDRAGAEMIAKRFRALADSLGTDQRARVVRRFADQIDAQVARASGDLPRAISLLREVAKAEPQSASTPPTSIPSYELLGDVLLEAKQPSEAVAAFRAALDARPKRTRPLLGLARALDAAGDRAAADETYRQIRDNWQRADAGVLETLRAQRGK